MKPVIIYVFSVIAALAFEWAFKVYSKKYTSPLSKSQWCCFFWLSAVLLCGICLMKPYDAWTFVEWSPMFLLAFFHVQQSQQREIVERYSAPKPGGSGITV